MVLKRAATVLIVAGFVAGCSVAATPSTTPQSASPTVSLPSISPTTVPTSSPTPSPSVTPSLTPAVWSTPRVVRRGECSQLSATIDETGRYHLVAVCDGGIRYLTSTGGADWAETPFVPAIDRLESTPIVAVDGDRVYVAYSLLAPREGGCGDDGLDDLGVYIRSSQGGEDDWSDPVRVGRAGDQLQSFRAVDGVLHLTVHSTNGTGPVFYHRQFGTSTARIEIPQAVSTSLRVGDDGNPRIAFATGHAIRYATAEGDGLVSRTIASNDETNLLAPSLVLAPGNVAHVVWTQNADGGGGCAGVEPGPLDGTYYATDAAGDWASRRISRALGTSSLTLDPATDRVHVLVWDRELQYLTVAPDEDWMSTTLTGTEGMADSVIRLDGATGTIAALASDFDGAIYLITKP